MEVAVGGIFRATLPDPPGGLGDLGLGARVEVPYTHAIATAWQAATLDLATGIWSVLLEGPLAAGDYLLVWMTPDDPPTYREFVPLLASVNLLGVGEPDFPLPDPEEVTPDPDEVAALERTRIVDAGGNDHTTFTETTNPSVAEVEDLIATARDIVLSGLRPAFPSSYWPQVRRAVTLQAAILLEGSYHREQLAEGAVGLWRQILSAQLAGLSASIDEALQHQVLSRGLEPTPLPAMPPTPITW